jgi:hypothetical protein
MQHSCPTVCGCGASTVDQAEFQVLWAVENVAWDNARQVAAANQRGSFLDRKRIAAREGFLDASIQLVAGDETLFRSELNNAHTVGEVTQNATVPLVCFTAGLSAGIPGLIPLPRRTIPLVRSMRCGVPGSIEVTQIGNQVTVFALPERTATLSCSAESYAMGIRRFHDEVVVQIDRHANALLTWGTLDPLFALIPIHSRYPGYADDTVTPPEESNIPNGTGAELSIWWSVPEAEWSRVRRERALNSPGCDFDRRMMIAEFLFGGYVRVYFRGAPIPVATPVFALGDQGVDRRWRAERRYETEVPRHRVWPLLGLAIQMAKMVTPADFLEPSAAQVRQFADLGRNYQFIGFEGVEAIYPQIRPSLLEELRDNVGHRAFEIGVRTFLADFVQSIRQRVPEALEWWSFRPLLLYLGE